MKIGKTYLVSVGAQVRLCADVMIGDSVKTLWFEVKEKDYLCKGHADAFVMLMLPEAMRMGDTIIYEDPISECLHYQLTEYYIPALCSVGDYYRQIKLVGPMISEKYPSAGGVAAIYEKTDDFLYTLAMHGSESGCSMTHIIVYNSGFMENSLFEQNFLSICENVKAVSKEEGRNIVFVNTNFAAELTEVQNEVAVFRKIACAFALQGLLSVYLLPSKYEAGRFQLKLSEPDRFDLLTASCCSTESLIVYTDGSEIKEQVKKQKINMNERNIQNNHMPIRIGMPYLAKENGKTRLCAMIRLQDKPEEMWFCVNDEYGRYLTEDRVDAFVVGVLTIAMRAERDIICDAPVTRRLLYQLNHYLIPMMASNLDIYHHIAVYAEPTEVKLECTGAVGTGWTGGVDSMFTFKKHFNAEESGRKLTHLLITSNGAIEGEKASDTLRCMVEKTERGFAAETGLRVLGVDTNLQTIQAESFLQVSTFRHASVALALQKLFGIYLVSSSYPISSFAFNREVIDYYELVVLNNVETDTTVLYSSGAVYARMQKISELSDFPLAYKYLHPCIYALRDNCGKCGKCIQTIGVLYGLGALEHFSEAFDLNEFEKHKDWYWTQLYMKKDYGNFGETVRLLQNKGVSFSHAKIIAMGSRLRAAIKRRL